MSLRLPVDLYSSDQLGAVILELRSYISALRSAEVRIKAGKPPAEAPRTSALLLGAFHGAGLKTDNPKSAEQLLEQLELVRKQAPIAHITLPDLPGRTLKRQLTVWFRTAIHPYLLLTFAVRSDMCGGIIVQAGSHIYDFSFREQLLQQRSRIAEIAGHV